MGAVRAGQWARSVCINANYELGSMLPQIDWAVNLKDYSVLVMNPNLSHDPKTKKKIPYSGGMQEHAVFVWEKYVVNSGFKDILLIAHSAGGGCTRAIQTQFADTFYAQVKEIAYTDSWVIEKDQLTVEQANFMEKRAIHYVSSNAPLGAPESTGWR